MTHTFHLTTFDSPVIGYCSCGWASEPHHYSRIAEVSEQYRNHLVTPFAD